MGIVELVSKELKRSQQNKQSLIKSFFFAVPIQRYLLSLFSHFLEVTGDVDEYKCEQGKSYKYQCNNCKCLAEGKLACSRRVCGPGEKRKRSAEEDVIRK